MNSVRSFQAVGRIFRLDFSALGIRKDERRDVKVRPFPFDKGKDEKCNGDY